MSKSPIDRQLSPDSLMGILVMSILDLFVGLDMKNPSEYHFKETLYYYLEKNDYHTQPQKDRTLASYLCTVILDPLSKRGEFKSRQDRSVRGLLNRIHDPSGFNRLQLNYQIAEELIAQNSWLPRSANDPEPEANIK